MGLLTDLEVYYKLDEGPGTRVEEIASLDVADSGSTPSTTGKIGLAANFSGSTFLSVATDPRVVFLDEALTINAWVQVSSGTTIFDQGYVSKFVTPSIGSQEYEFRYRGALTRYEFTVFDGVSTILARADNFGAPATGVYHMVTCIHDPVANTISIRVNDGTPDVVAHTLGMSGGVGDLNIGQGGGANSRSPVDEVGIWRRVLSAADITELFNSNAGLPFAQFGGVDAAKLAVPWYYGP